MVKTVEAFTSDRVCLSVCEVFCLRDGCEFTDVVGGQIPLIETESFWDSVSTRKRAKRVHHVRSGFGEGGMLQQQRGRSGELELV